jgi:UMF1 family MFS transporter
VPFRLTRKEVAWAFYDWGNSAFATVVMASLFPLMLRGYWLPADAAPETGTILLGKTSAIAGILVAAIAPLAGAIGDRRGNRATLLAAFALCGIGATMMLAGSPAADPTPAVIAFIVATIGFAGANAFYDSLLISVTERKRFDFVSGVGFSLGYLGGGLLFGCIVFALAKPESFGFADATAVAKAAFVLVGVWWLVFTLPLLFSVKDKVDKSVKPTQAVVAGVKQLLHTFQDVRKDKTVFIFLLAYFFYIDGVNTVMKMAVDYGAALKLPQSSLVKALLVTQFVGFPAAIIYSKLGEKIGAAKGILIGICVYAVSVIFASKMNSVAEFYGLAVVIGLVQGGVQALSRSLFASLIPPDKASEYFGFYNMLGKLSSILGPFLMAYVAAKTGNNRISILSLLLLFGLGGIILVYSQRRPTTTES